MVNKTRQKHNISKELKSIFDIENMRELCYR